MSISNPIKVTRPIRILRTPFRMAAAANRLPQGAASTRDVALTLTRSSTPRR